VNLLARLPGARPTGKALVLSSHMDVVQAVAADWTFDPFSGDVANDYVYGRGALDMSGALDMKGMGVMELMTLLLLKRQGVALSRDVLLLATCDEEVGSALGARLMAEQYFADLDPACVLDEGGTGLRGFFSAGDVFDVAVNEKRVVRIRLVARAEPGHGSQPFDEAATHRLVRAAYAVLSQVAEDRVCPPVAEMIRRLGGATARQEMASHRATRPLLHDTVSLTMLSGGYKVNILPEQAEMHFDCRLLPDTDEQAFVSNVEQIVNDPAIRLEITWPSARPAEAPWDGSTFYTAIEQACAAHAPGALPSPGLSVMGTDGRFFRERGVPTYGLVPCLFTAEDLKGYHGVDERLSVANLRLGTQIIHDLTLRIAAASAD
jgi:acetylornithine deacetylase/succinyl-diaminopimelate desuccinylase-like protein